MGENNIKQKVVYGAVWKFSERILAQVVSLMVSIIIARLLDPSDYGVVSLVTIFFTFANIIISGGLNTALIQKKDADREDYNSVFTVSFIIALVIYGTLFLAAPWIAECYHQPILKSIIRVLGLSLPIYALKAIVCAYVSSRMQFKMFFVATLGGTLLSALVGITMAINGFGAWALVAQQLTNTIVDTIILFWATKLRLAFQISIEKLRPLFRYGSKIFLSSLMGVTINQINPLFIGLKYTSADLSFYTKGRSFPETISGSITYTLSSVLFPAMAKYQDDKERLLQYTRLYMRIASFIVFPVMLGFFAVSENFILFFLTEKWLPAVYYIQIACVALMFDIVAAGNCETIKAMGRSDVYLKIEIIKKLGYFVTLFLFLVLTNSPKGLALSTVICTVIQISVNSIPNRKLIGYKGIYQLQDLIPNLIISVVMLIFVLFLGELKFNPGIELFLQIVIGGVLYLGIAFITKNQSLKEIMGIMRNKNLLNN